VGNGISGVVTVLYELGYEKSALLVLNNLIDYITEDKIDITEDKIDNTEDISLYSGLSRIGLLYLSFYKILEDNTLLERVKLIYNRIISIYRNNIEEGKNSISDFGLVTGWSGAALFLFKSSSIIHDCYDGKAIAFEILDKSFEPAVENDIYDDLFIIDDSRGFKRLIPYIDNGSCGLALTMLEFQRKINLI
jgi:hypothetical protein